MLSWRKKISGCLLAAFVVLLFFSHQPAAGQNRAPKKQANGGTNIQVYIDGSALNADSAPLIEKGRTLVPLRAIFEALGADVQWNGADRSITAAKDRMSVRLQIGSSVAQKNGIQVKLDVPPRLIKGSTLVPLRFVSEALGAEVTWDGNSRRVNIFSASGAAKAFSHLNQVMDKYHYSFDVYSDWCAAGNHFAPSGWMGSGINTARNSIKIDDIWGDKPYSGTSCIKIGYFSGNGDYWAGIYWQHPENNWGTVPGVGYDLSGAAKLTFYARGETGREKVEFFAGGITGDYPDSLSKATTGCVTLTNQWQKYEIDIRGQDLRHVIGGFGFVTYSYANPNGATFYLDEIKYEKNRLDQPRFLASYETISNLAPDKYLINSAFTYDNALALLAYLAGANKGGQDGNLERAKALADSLVYAQEHDCSFTDGRLRNAYMAGDLTDAQTGKVRLPGWYDPEGQKWCEDNYHRSTYTGNMAWAIIALTEYYNTKGGESYLAAARTLGEWIYKNTCDSRGPGGYTGGFGYNTGDWESAPSRINWKSTEHNLDTYVAFMRLFRITNDPVWKERAEHANAFVQAMWNPDDGHFWTGTLDDGATINKDVIPLDIQAWTVMAFPDVEAYRKALGWAEKNCLAEHHGFKGFDFNPDKDGVWFEGTAQMSLAYALAGETGKAQQFLLELGKAQREAANSNDKGIVAACHDGVSTGFDWEYFSRPHVGATAWYLFAEQNYNPFWGTILSLGSPAS